jgi:hypothetical protein
MMTALHGNPSQAGLILAHLQNGASLTAISALTQYGCFRLAARIHELRKEGYQIEETTLNHNGKRYSEYFIPTFKLEAA